MGTKAKPGQFDCYSRLWDDEPYFVLMGRDPAFRWVVEHWIGERRSLKESGTKDISSDQLREAEYIIEAAEKFQREVYLPWRASSAGAQAALNGINKNAALSAFNAYLAGEGRVSLTPIDFAQLMHCLREAIAEPQPGVSRTNDGQDFEPHDHSIAVSNESDVVVEVVEGTITAVEDELTIATGESPI